MIKNYENLEVHDGSRVYLNGDDNMEHVEEIEIFETVRKVVRVYSSNAITREEAVAVVEELYDDAEIVLDGNDDVYDLKIC